MGTNTKVSSDLERLLEKAQYVGGKAMDNEVRLILADYYEERGELDRANFWREINEPFKFPQPTDYEDGSKGLYFWWFDTAEAPICLHEEVDKKVFQLLRKDGTEKWGARECHAAYKSVSEAYEALFVAWKTAYALSETNNE